jgi:ribosome-binding protein aMBF1 (putative translation factor)
MYPMTISRRRGRLPRRARGHTSLTGLSQKNLAAKAKVSHDVISKIETRERPPAEDFPSRLDAVPELNTCRALFACGIT